MRKALLLAVLLGGCATIKTLEGASLTTSQVYAAANAWDAAEITATNYLGLPLCTPGVVVCRTQEATVAIISAGRGGNQARKALVSACIANIASNACVSAYTTLTTAFSGLQTVFAQYSVQKGS